MILSKSDDSYKYGSERYVTRFALLPKRVIDRCGHEYTIWLERYHVLQVYRESTGWFDYKDYKQWTGPRLKP